MNAEWDKKIFEINAVHEGNFCDAERISDLIIAQTFIFKTIFIFHWVIRHYN